MGAEIEGIGTGRLVVHGKPALHGARHRVLPDRIEWGTYAMAAAITGGDLELIGGDVELLPAVFPVLAEAGIAAEDTASGIRVWRPNGHLHGIDVMTEPFPGFPTDLQAQMMALMTVADGAAMITATIFENRFLPVPELRRLGANTHVHGAPAMVRARSTPATRRVGE